MAKQTITTEYLIDDIDGSEAHQTVHFAVDGTTYEIELSNKNATAFQKAIRPYVDAARRVRGGAKSTTRAKAAPKKDLAAVRQWAIAEGYEVSDRGRIPYAVVSAYDEAH